MKYTHGIIRVSAILALIVPAGGPAAEEAREKWALVHVLKRGEPVTGVAFSPDGKTLAVAGYSMVDPAQNVALFDTAAGPSAGNFRGGFCAAFSPDGKLLASCVPGGAEIWVLSSGENQATLTGHETPFTVPSVAFSPDSQRAATSGYDGTVRLWNVENGKAIAVLRGHTHWVYQVAFAANGKTLLSASRDGTGRLWDPSSLEERRVLNHCAAPHAVRSIAMTVDGTTVATASTDGTIKLWDADTGKEQAVLAVHTGAVYRVAFAPDGKTLLSASADNTARIWNVATRELLGTLDAHTDQAPAVAFSPDGSQFATGGFDGTVRLYSFATAKR